MTDETNRPNPAESPGAGDPQRRERQAPPAPRRERDTETETWARAFAAGRDLDSIRLEIEPANPMPPRRTTPAPATPEDEAEPDAPRAPARETTPNATDKGDREATGEGAAAPSTPPPAARRTPAPEQPAVYELDLGEADGLRTETGAIDWSRALRSTSRKRPPTSTPKPATPPPAPTTPDPSVDAWTRMPGAEKVLRATPPSSPPGAPGTPARGKAPDSTPSPVRPASGPMPDPVTEPIFLSPPPPPAPPPVARPTAPSADERPLSRYEQLKRQPSFQMDPEAVKIANEFSEIMFHISKASHLLKAFRGLYPYLIAPNIFAVWEDNLKETTTMMLREFQHMRDPKKKQYDRKYVCNSCKSVFFISLPDGICDECRGRMGTQAPY